MQHLWQMGFLQMSLYPNTPVLLFVDPPTPKILSRIPRLLEDTMGGGVHTATYRTANVEVGCGAKTNRSTVHELLQVTCKVGDGFNEH